MTELLTLYDTKSFKAWNDLFNELKGRIEQLRDTINNAPETAPLHDHFRKLLNYSDESNVGLLNFAQSQFNYFLFGFSGLTSSESDPIERSKTLAPFLDLPPEYILQSTLNQIAYDLSTIEDAWNDRLIDDAARKDALERADERAYNAIQLPKNRRLKVRTGGVIPYIQRIEISVRVVPYSDITVVGLPELAIGKSSNRDMDAISHEVAHDVYWHGTVEDKFVHQYLQNWIDEPKQKFTGYQREWFKSWVEELFADIYGLVLSGPDIAKSGQLVRLTDLPELLAKSEDGDPPGILRPYFYIWALDEIWKNQKDSGTYKWTCSIEDIHKEIEELTSSWDKITSERLQTEAPSQFEVTPVQSPTEKYRIGSNRIGEISRSIRPLIVEILDLLLVEHHQKDSAAPIRDFIVKVRDPALVEMSRKKKSKDPSGGDSPVSSDIWLEVFEAEGWRTDGLPGGNAPK